MMETVGVESNSVEDSNKLNNGPSYTEGKDWIISMKETPLLKPETDCYKDVISSIKQHVSDNMIVVSNCFQKYDLQPTGVLKVSDFRKGLKALGLENLTETQLEALEKQYSIVGQPETCDWLRFVEDVEMASENETNKRTKDHTIANDSQGKENFGFSPEDLEPLSFSRECDETNAGYVTTSNDKQCHDEEIVNEDEKMKRGRSWKKTLKRFNSTVSPLPTSKELEELPSHAKTESDSPTKLSRDHRLSISYEFLLWSVFLVSTILCVVDHFVRNGDVVLGRSGKLPRRIWGTNFGETLTNVVWAVTARLIITSQNMMFYTMLWCFPNTLSEIAPRWLRFDGIRDIHTKVHRLTGVFLIAIPSVVHVLVIFVPPLIDGTQLKYYPPSTFNYSKSPDHLNWSSFWDPAAVHNWTFNDRRGVHLTADEIYRFVLMIVMFCFLFPLSRSEYLNSRSYSTAITIHTLAGIWYAIDNIRKITHGLAHVVNLPMLLIWCIDRLLCIFVYRKCKGKIVKKDVIGNNEYMVAFLKLNNEEKRGVGDVFYIHNKMFQNMVPQRAHPFTSFSNHGMDSSWDIGFVMTVIEDYNQWFLPWTNWLGPREQVPSLNVWGPYRSSVWQLHELLKSPSKSTPSRFILLASGSGFGYLLDVLGILAYKTNSDKNGKNKKLKIDIHYSVRSAAFCKYFQEHTNHLLQKIKDKNVALVTFNCYVTGEVKNLEQESEMNVFNCRLDIEKVLKTADKKTFISFVGRPAIADEINKICEKKNLSLIKDYTNGQRGNQDKTLLSKYLKLTIWAVFIIVALCLLAHVFIDMNQIRKIVQIPINNRSQNKTQT